MRRDTVGDWRLGDDASRPTADPVTTVQTRNHRLRDIPWQESEPADERNLP